MKKVLLFLSVLTLSTRAQVVFNALTVPTLQTLRGVSFSDSLTGYACGDAGTFIKTTDGGVTWISLNVNTTENLWDVKVIPGSAGQGVMVAGENNTVRKTVNGGTGWTSQNIPFAAGSFVFGIQCLDNLNYFACGGDYGTLSGAILKTTDGGATWSKTAIPSSIFLDKVFMQTLTKGFTAGTNSSFSDGSVHKTTNSTTWAAAKTSNSIITNVWCPSNLKVVAVGLNGQIWRSADGGTTWASKSANTTDLYGIQFRDSLNGFACGGSGAGSIILSTTDGGNSWTINSSYSYAGSLLSVSIAQNKIFIVGDHGKILKASLPALPPPVIIGIAESQGTGQIEVFEDRLNHNIRFKIPQDLLKESLSLLITDMQGATTRSVKVPSVISDITTEDIAPGIYFYRLVSNGSVYKAGKVIIH